MFISACPGHKDVNKTGAIVACPLGLCLEATEHHMELVKTGAAVTKMNFDGKTTMMSEYLSFDSGCEER